MKIISNFTMNSGKILDIGITHISNKYLKNWSTSNNLSKEVIGFT